MRISVILVLGLLVFLGWQFWPEEHQPKLPPPKKTLQIVKPPQTKLTPLPPPIQTSLPPEKTTPEARYGLGAKVQDAQPHREQKRAKVPSELSLREQVIALRGDEWQLRIMVSLSSDDPQVMLRAIPYRNKLIEMLYFLVSHRVAESLRTPSGEERLRTDLHQRYANVLRSKNFELNFDSLNLEERSLPVDE